MTWPFCDHFTIVVPQYKRGMVSRLFVAKYFRLGYKTQLSLFLFSRTRNIAIIQVIFGKTPPAIIMTTGHFGVFTICSFHMLKWPMLVRDLTQIIFVFTRWWPWFNLSCQDWTQITFVFTRCWPWFNPTCPGESSLSESVCHSSELTWKDELSSVSIHNDSHYTRYASSLLHHNNQQLYMFTKVTKVIQGVGISRPLTPQIPCARAVINVLTCQHGLGTGAVHFLRPAHAYSWPQTCENTITLKGDRIINVSHLVKQKTLPPGGQERCLRDQSVQANLLVSGSSTRR